MSLRTARTVSCIVLPLVALVGCHDRDEFRLTEARIESILTLRTESGATSLPADGFSRLTLVAQIDPHSALNRRTIVFRTSLGSLNGGEATDDGQSVVADSNGIARIDLVSEALVGVATVSASVEDVVVSLRIDFVEVDVGDLIFFVEVPAEAPADGATLSVFSVSVSPAVPRASRTVEFTTTAGSFAGPSGGDSISVEVTDDGVATAFLKSPLEITTGHVQAAVTHDEAEFSREATISFVRALPEAILVSTDVVRVDVSPPSRTVMVTARLIRDVGQVTENTVATFSAVDEAGNPVGSFFNVDRTDTDGNATAELLLNVTAPDRITITVGADGTSVEGTAVVEVIEPEP